MKDWLSADLVTVAPPDDVELVPYPNHGRLYSWHLKEQIKNTFLNRKPTSPNPILNTAPPPPPWIKHPTPLNTALWPLGRVALGTAPEGLGAGANRLRWCRTSPLQTTDKHQKHQNPGEVKLCIWKPTTSRMGWGLRTFFFDFRGESH